MLTLFSRPVESALLVLADRPGLLFCFRRGLRFGAETRRGTAIPDDPYWTPKGAVSSERDLLVAAPGYRGLRPPKDRIGAPGGVMCTPSDSSPHVRRALFILDP